jgi:HD superfamily phosphohydrolase
VQNSKRYEVKFILQIRDPIHGMIELNEGEKAIIDHEAFQRLRNIHQLALTYKIYPGAVHTRFEHSIGVMHLAGKMMDSLYARPIIYNNFSKEEFKRLKQLVRLAGLLHDLGHGPFSHVSEEIFEKGLKHEAYSVAIIKQYFTPIIQKYFSNIKVEEIIVLLSKGYLGPDKLFLGKIIDGELDADKLDYLLRDSYYCGVKYGKYDLDRILDTITVIPMPESSSGIENDNGLENEVTGLWMLGIDSDGIQAVEELIFARYWMFIQVYFHKTRRIYDYYLSNFLKDFLKEKYNTEYLPDLKNLDKFIEIDDCAILEAIKEMRNKNEWARRIFYRDHLSEVFVTSPHHMGLESYMTIKELKKKFEKEFKNATCYIDEKARKLPTNPFFSIKSYEEEENEAKKIDKLMASILVQDKHEPKQISPIFDVSLPIKLLSQKNINIIRFYTDKENKDIASKWCSDQYRQIQSKVLKIKDGWN